VTTTYDRLAAPFDHTFSDNRGGVELTYITGEQCISRLNEVLGPAGWSFTVREHGINAEADECWALGRLTAHIDGTTVLRDQFGSQKVKRSRSSGNPLDIGFDLKGAGTDALKKCASLLGVGLYLSKKEEQSRPFNGARTESSSGTRSARAAEPATSSAPAPGSTTADDAHTCADCGKELQETRFRDGTVWPPSQLAGYGRRKHNRVLCMEHYRAANDARRKQERSDDF
jgi:hypothetical protein